MGLGREGERRAPRAPGIGVQRHLSRLRGTGWAPCGWGGICIFVLVEEPPWFLPSSGSLRTHNKPTCARPPGTWLCFLYCKVCKEAGGDAPQSPGSFRSRLLGLLTKKTEARGGGGDPGTITNARAPSPRIPRAQLALRSRPAEPGHCLRCGGGSGAWGSSCGRWTTQTFKRYHHLSIRPNYRV